MLLSRHFAKRMLARAIRAPGHHLFRPSVALAKRSYFFTSKAPVVSPLKSAADQWRDAVAAGDAPSVEASIQKLWEHSVRGDDSQEKHKHDGLPSLAVKPTETVSSKLAGLVVLEGRNIEQALFVDSVILLNKAKQTACYTGLLQLLDAFVLMRDASGARRCFEEIRQSGQWLDRHSLEQLVALASAQGQISLIEELVQHHGVTHNMLLVSAEPLILGGHTKTCADLFSKFLQRSPALSDVLVVVKEILRARARRALTWRPLTASEQEGVEIIETQLTELLDSREESSQNTEPDYATLDNALRNYLHLSSEWRGADPYPIEDWGQSESNLFVPQVSPHLYLPDHRITHSLVNENSYTGEEKDLLIDSISPWTAKPTGVEQNRYKNLSEEDYLNEMVNGVIDGDVFYLEEETEITAEDLDDLDGDDDDLEDDMLSADDADDDSVDDEENKMSVEEFRVDGDNSHRNAVAREMDSLGNMKKLPEQAKMNDLSQSLKNTYPTVMVEYSEDIFDGVSDQHFVRDELLVKNRKEKLAQKTFEAEGIKSLEKLKEKVIDRKGPDDEGGVGQSVKTPAISKEES